LPTAGSFLRWYIRCEIWMQRCRKRPARTIRNPPFMALAINLLRLAPVPQAGGGLLVQSVSPKTKIESVITDDAVVMLSEKLSTPLQFEYYLTRALEEAYKVGQKPVGADMIENVLAKDINGLEPRLTRQGYNAKVLAELLNAKPREIRSFLSGQLASGRTQELQSELLAAGIPL
jgi:hypothetical protein